MANHTMPAQVCSPTLLLWQRLTRPSRPAPPDRSFEEASRTDDFLRLPFAALRGVLAAYQQRLDRGEGGGDEDAAFRAAWGWVVSDVEHVAHLEEVLKVVKVPGMTFQVRGSGEARRATFAHRAFRQHESAWSRLARSPARRGFNLAHEYASQNAYEFDTNCRAGCCRSLSPLAVSEAAFVATPAPVAAAAAMASMIRRDGGPLRLR